MTPWDASTLNDSFAEFDREIALIDASLEAEAVFAEELMADLDSGLPLIETADSLASEPVNLPPEIIQGFLHQSLKGVLGSASKARKTWILLDMALCVATGLPFWGMNTVQGNVLYINFEIPREFLKSRLLHLSKTKGATLPDCLHVWNLRGKAAPLWKLLPDFLRRLKRNNYRLVIIDPIYKSLGGREENAAEDVAQICNEMEQIAVEAGCAVMYAAHFSKGNQAAKDAIDRISGSGVWGRDADSLMIMTKHEEEDCYTVETILRNLPEQPPFVVRWQFPLMIRDTSLDPQNLKKPGGRAPEYNPISFLQAIAHTTEKNPISISAWSVAANVSRQTLQGYLQKIRFNGWIATTGEGNSARQFITRKGLDAIKSYPADVSPAEN